MANNISGNPWTVTTAGVLLKSKVKIKNLNWTNGTNGNILIIQDNLGRDIVRDVWSSTRSFNYGEFSWVAGVNVVQIDGGELSISVGK